MSRYFLTSYRSLCETLPGRLAATRYDHPSFVDDSCRREPDFEAEWPSISALCHAGKFAPRLYKGHKVAYITRLGRYGKGEQHWRLTALLQVAERFESHEAAAEWYRENGVPLPRNCLVLGNTPLSLEHAIVPSELKPLVVKLSAERVLRQWDRDYKARAKQNPVFLACNKIFLNLSNPPRIYRNDWLQWLGKVPRTRNPPEISEKLWQNLCERAGVQD